MTTEALTMIVVDILGKYMLDSGAALLKEAGQAAAQAAFKLYELVLNRLKEDPADARNVERFAENPAGYQVPIADAIAEKLGSDPNFSAQLIMFVTEFQKAARSYRETHNEAGSGAVATHGSIAAGKGGVAVGGNVKGSITVHNTESRSSSGGTGT